MKQFIVFFLLIFLIIPTAFSGSKIYVWVDESGNTQFTDYPPPQQDTTLPYKEIETKTPSEASVMDNNANVGGAPFPYPNQNSRQTPSVPSVPQRNTVIPSRPLDSGQNTRQPLPSFSRALPQTETPSETSVMKNNVVKSPNVAEYPFSRNSGQNTRQTPPVYSVPQRNAVNPLLPLNSGQNTGQTPPTLSTVQSQVGSYEFYKIQLEREACFYLKRGTREWSNCRAEVKKRYGEICRDEKLNLERNLRQAYCALADYMTIIEEVR